MITDTLIEGFISEKLQQDEMFVVEIVVRPGNKIAVVVDNDNGVPISYCIELSKLIESNLDREVEDFELEVSSAGIGQPFKVLRQYKKNIGREVEMLTTAGKKLSGKLLSTDDTGFEVEIGEMIKLEGKKRKELQLKTVRYSFDEVKQVKDIISF
ncbi:ribosome assembly cofactor RimP [Carboxylicivirga sp. N1Y90]|uniref:ribosome assembly cofactor RimP n=1 Tax=Carboxylicivirga fragile TaxID=3417571 RepID=UPI003D327576|nr:ribosome assembly cofactor RimP [Marinilabiliaceae bacterium N1Y90]